jgi:hypothetical protein
MTRAAKGCRVKLGSVLTSIVACSGFLAGLQPLACWGKSRAQATDNKEVHFRLRGSDGVLARGSVGIGKNPNSLVDAGAVPGVQIANVIYPQGHKPNAKTIERVQTQLKRIGLAPDEGQTYILLPEGAWRGAHDDYHIPARTSKAFTIGNRTYLRNFYVISSDDDTLAKTLLHEYGHRVLSLSQKAEDKVCDWTATTWNQIQKTNAVEERAIPETHATPELAEPPVESTLHSTFPIGLPFI